MIEHRTRALNDILPGALALGLVTVVFIHGRRATTDLDWPYDADLFRDIAQAQTIADGHPFSDPAYRDETIWYNPLQPAIVAALSKCSALPLHAFCTRVGAYLNLFAPLAFYLLVSAFFGGWTGLAALAFFLFATRGPDAPSWACATYSPWPFTATFVQTLFYLSLLVYRRALQTDRARWYVATGAAIGFTFLGHTAPALILGTMIVLRTAQVIWDNWDEDFFSAAIHQAVLRLLTVMAVAFLVSLPLACSILFRYRMAVLNPVPTEYLWGPLALQSLWLTLSKVSLPLLLLMGFGLAALWKQRTQPTERRIVLLWIASAGLFLVHSYIEQAMRASGAEAPSIVPNIHFVFYLKACQALLLGYGLVVLTRAVGAFAVHCHLGGEVGGGGGSSEQPTRSHLQAYSLPPIRATLRAMTSATIACSRSTMARDSIARKPSSGCEQTPGPTTFSSPVTTTPCSSSRLPAGR